MFSSQDANQRCGTVVQAAQSANGEWLAIVSMQTNAAGQGTLHWGSPNGAALALVTLRYVLPYD